MASARDLLQQADALMRSNRNVGASDPGETVPLLTDIAVPGSAGVSHRQHRTEIPVLTNAVTTIPDSASGVLRESESRAQFSLTSAMPDSTIFPISQMPQTTILGPAPAAAEGQTEPDSTIFPISQMPQTTILGPAPAAAEGQTESDSTIFPISQMPQTTILGPAPAAAEGQTESDFSETAMRTQLAEIENWDAELITSAPPSPPPAPAAAGPSAAEIAETVYFQVLQNLDLYTERALQEHLTSHLSPILERASSELLATLHANLGALIRQFVAEAIEKQLGVRPDSIK
jgi:hypothetical protein